MRKGIVFTMISAVVYGVAPVFTKITYEGGANGVTISFLRVLSLPVLFVIMRAMKISLSLTKKEAIDVFAACGLGFGVTTLLLFCSYSHIPVGMATTLHFIYPIAVSFACIVFFREKLSMPMLFALVMCSAGVVLFTGNTSGASAKGIAMALASGLTYAFFLVYVDKSELKNMNHFKISFWMGVMLVLFSGVFGTLTGTLPLNLTMKAWGLAAVLSICKAVVAVTTLQIGIQLSGATTASILSTLEPITSFALGVLILGESFSTAKAMGVICVVIAVITISAQKK
ncbi:MAG: DMT family transporter [Synergistaceae bacterium]|jgi:drug/metabolite transporter (DMT)-like permease|nr:DMT family transporter [Synergistaceae bacterium]